MPDEMTLDIANAIRKNSHALTGASSDYDALIQQVGDARFVLLGEASHGTHEFYRARAQITRRLIKEKNFNAVAVEADWPDAYRINSYIRGASADAEAIDSLAGFKRFPTWIKWIPKPHGVRAIATPVSIISARTPRLTVMPPASI